MQDLLHLDCVEEAFVPDMYLLNKIGTDKNIVYKSFGDPDRFAVRLKQNCLEGAAK